MVTDTIMGTQSIRNNCGNKSSKKPQ